MRRHHQIVWGIVAGLTMHASADAVVRVVTCNVAAPAPVQGPDGRWTVFIPGSIANSNRTYNVIADAGDSIASITIGADVDGQRNSGTLTLNVVACNATLPCASGFSCATQNLGVGNVDLISFVEDPNRSDDRFFIGEIAINGDLGAVTADNVVTRIVALGTINGPVTVADSIPLIRGAQGIYGNIQATTGTIGSIYAGDDDFDPSTDAADRDIGTSNSPVTIRANDTITEILARNVYADIQPLWDAGFAADGTLGNFRASGDVDGRISTNIYTNRILRVGQDLIGDLTFGSKLGLPGDNCGGDSQIWIERSFKSSASIEFKPDAALLGGQVSINRDSPNTGSWESGAFIKIGDNGVLPAPLTVTTPQYQLTLDDTGCGSVGLAPYAVHEQGSFPLPGNTIRPSRTPRMRFYGPVWWIPSNAASFILDRRLAGTSNPWQNVSGSCSGFRPAPIAGSFGPRNVFPSGYSFQHGFEYRMTPITDENNSNRVRCDLFPVSRTLIVVDESFEFEVFNPCPADLNGDGLVNGADLSIMLGQFNATNTGCGLTADTNTDDVVNGADLSVLLAAFNIVNPSCAVSLTDEDPYDDEANPTALAGALSDRPLLTASSILSAPASSSGQHDADTAPRRESATGGEPPFTGFDIVQAFGYTTIESYAAWVNTMTPAEFANHAEVLQGVIAELESTAE